MRHIFKAMGLLVVCSAISLGGVGISNAVDILPEAEDIVGVIGVTPALDGSCISVWVPLDEKDAVAGLRWFNNDDTSFFPQVLIQSGEPNSPAVLKGALEVATDVNGSESGWSDVEFSEPIAASGAGVYAIFSIQAGAELEEEGRGGGPAIGYTLSPHGLPGWISSDGVDWVRVHPKYGFAVEPILVARSDDMLSKSQASDDPGLVKGGNAVDFVTSFNHPAPNPFNPQTTLSFSLARDCFVDLAVYNVRGEMVGRVVNESLTAGHHSYPWNAKDENGAPIASGVYFARFKAGSVIMTKRMVLVQ